MDILVWGGLGNSDYLEKMMSFSNIYLYFWLKRKQGISRVYIWCFFISSNPQLSSSASFLRLNVLSSLN